MLLPLICSDISITNINKINSNMRKLLLFFGLLLTAVVVKAAPQTWSDGNGNSVEYDVAGNEVRIAVSNAGALAAFFSSQDANAVFQGNQTLLKIEKKGDDGALNADDLYALNSSTHSGLARFTKVNMEKVALEEGASVKVMSLSGAQYMALPHGTSIADMKALGTNCTSLKAVAATNVDPNPTEFTGYSWAAGEIWNICQLEPKLVDGLEKGICKNTMQKLTLGGYLNDKDASTSAPDENTVNPTSYGTQTAKYYLDGVATDCAQDYIPSTNSNDGKGCSPWKGNTEISLDFTEAIFPNKGDLALVSPNVTELLLPTESSFTEIKPFMFANLKKLKHIIVPDNIVTIGDGAFYVNDATSVLEEISIGKGIKTIGNAAFAAPTSQGSSRANLTEIRFANGISNVKILSTVFAGCNSIKHMMLPEGIVSIGERCFSQLLELESVHFPTTLEYIGRDCFRQTGLTMLTIPASVKVIDMNAFSLCRITDIYLMAESVNQLPYIYAMQFDYTIQDYSAPSTFDSNMLNGNNTTAPVSQHDEFASSNSQEGEELFRLSVNGGNTITKLHFHENLKDFIDLNPWYFEGQTTPKPNSDALSGNGGINETKHLSDTYYLVDNENHTYPAQDAWDLARPTWAAYFSGASHTWDAVMNNEGKYSLTTDYTKEAGTQTPYYNPETGVLSSVTEDTEHVFKVLRKEGWRQFTFKAGDAGSEEITFHKQYDNVWYTMCFPFSLTDEQLESAFNAEYNIADFSGIEVIEENDKGNKEIVLHFNKIAKAKYYDLDHNEYQRVDGSKQQEVAPNGAIFNTYTYTRGGDNYTYVSTFSNKSYAKDGNKENGIVYIDGYLSQAGRPYMIHPNLGTSEGQPSTMTHMVGINYYSRDAEVIDQLCKDLARSVDLGTGKGYEGVTYAAEDASDIAIKEDEEGNKIEITENIAQAAYSKYSGQTYSFVGNCNEYSASAPPYPSVANGGLEPDPEYPAGAVVKPAETIENPNPELVDPATKYTQAFITLYNTSVEYIDKNDGWKRKTSTYGEIIANNDQTIFASYSQDGINYYMTQHNNESLDFSALQSYFGGNTQSYTDTEYSTLKTMCSNYVSDVAAWNAGTSSPEYQAYLANKAANEAYNTALQAYLEENPGSTESDFNDYVSGLIGAYNSELQGVQRRNEAKVAEWNNNRQQYAVYIPENAYFLSRKSGEYYTHFFREKASLEKRKQKGTGKWSRYSAVLIPNDAALNGVEVAQDPSASKAFSMAFDEAFYAAEDATAIEQVVEEAREKGMKVEYINVVVSIDGKVVRRGDTSLEGLPSGLYIVNGKKYFVK